MHNKEYSELTFTDDFMFSKILRNNEKLTKELVELILGIKISKIVRLEAQHSLEDSYESKGIRLDVYLEDDENNVYDIEMQTYVDGNLVTRNRYYHSLMAVDNLNKGARYNDIKHSYVIFICTFDPFKLNSPIYTARTRFDEHPNVLVDDGAVSVFLNCESTSDRISPELQAFFKYVRERQPLTSLTNEIERDLVTAINQTKWRHEYMTLWEYEEIARDEGRAEGIAEGLAQGLINGQAKAMVNYVDLLAKKENLAVDKVCKILEVTVDDYEKAKEQLS